MAARDCSASVPTVTSRATPAARAASMTSTSTPSYGTWQWLSVHMPRIGESGLLAGEERVPLLDGEPARILTPRGGRLQLLLGRRARETDATPQLVAGVRHGWAGQDGDDAQNLQR